MKTLKIIIALAIFATTTSCTKDYTCTCTTVVGAVSSNVKHDINNTRYDEAVKSCKNYEEQANNSLPGGTTCHL